MKKEMATDIEYWNARYEHGKEIRQNGKTVHSVPILWNKLRFLTHHKYESVDTRKCRIFLDEVGWEDRLTAYWNQYEWPRIYGKTKNA